MGKTAEGFDTWLDAAMHRARIRNDADLAGRVGVSGSTVSRWKTGGAQPEVEVCRRLAQVLGKPILEVLVAAGHLTKEEARLRDLPTSLPPRELTPEEALAADPRLSDRQRKHLLSQLELLVEHAEWEGLRDRRLQRVASTRDPNAPRKGKQEETSK